MKMIQTFYQESLNRFVVDVSADDDELTAVWMVFATIPEIKRFNFVFILNKRYG
jgi:hypothetical protein